MRKRVVLAAAVLLALAAVAARFAFAGGDPVPTCVTGAQSSVGCRSFTVDWTIGPPQAFQYDAEHVVGQLTIALASGNRPTIDIYAYNWADVAANVLGGGPGGGGGVGKAEFQDLTVVKLIDESSPVLAAACATGLHMHDAQLVVKSKEGTMTYDLLDILCSLDKHGASGQKEQLPLEELSLNYRAITWTFTPKKGDPVRRSFDTGP